MQQSVGQQDPIRRKHVPEQHRGGRVGVELVEKQSHRFGGADGPRRWKSHHRHSAGHQRPSTGRGVVRLLLEHGSASPHSPLVETEQEPPRAGLGTADRQVVGHQEQPIAAAMRSCRGNRPAIEPGISARHGPGGEL